MQLSLSRHTSLQIGAIFISIACSLNSYSLGFSEAKEDLYQECKFYQNEMIYTYYGDQSKTRAEERDKDISALTNQSSRLGDESDQLVRDLYTETRNIAKKQFRKMFKTYKSTYVDSRQIADAQLSAACTPNKNIDELHSSILKEIAYDLRRLTFSDDILTLEINSSFLQQNGACDKKESSLDKLAKRIRLQLENPVELMVYVEIKTPEISDARIEVPLKRVHAVSNVPATLTLNQQSDWVFEKVFPKIGDIQNTLEAVLRNYRISGNNIDLSREKEQNFAKILKSYTDNIQKQMALPSRIADRKQVLKAKYRDFFSERFTKEDFSDRDMFPMFSQFKIRPYNECMDIIEDYESK